MRRTMKIVLWSLGTLLTTILAAFIFLAAAGDDFYRWALDEVIEGTIDREITVDGTFSFELGMQPSITVTDVWIENAAWTGKKEMARAKRLEVTLALEPLFSGILHLPHLVVEGLTVDLEEAPDGQRNWEINGVASESDPTETPELIYPLFDSVSLTDIAVTYKNNESGQEIELLLHSLNKLEQINEAAPYEIRGEGSLNQRPFSIAAEVGTVEEAIAAVEPYPLKASIKSANLLVEIFGTARNFPAGEGFDLKAVARTSSIYEILKPLQIESRPFGPALASVRLWGDLNSLAAEEIHISVIAPSGEELQAQGRIANLTRGFGLDLQFGGKLDPQVFDLIGDMSPGVDGALDGLTDMAINGHLTGTFERPALKELGLSLEHIDGSEINLDGAVAADLSGGEFALVEFEAATEISLPDQVSLAKALGVRIPDLSEIKATADLVWAGDWVTARSITLEGNAWEKVNLRGEGKLGRFSGTDMTFDLDVQSDLSGNAASTQPLVYLILGFSSSQWRVRDISADNLILMIQRELIAAGADPGVPDGKIGPKTRTAIENYQASQGLAVDGQATDALLQRLRQTTGGKASAVPEPQPTFEFSDPLPDLGSIEATMRLFFKDDMFHFEDLDLTLGKKGADWVNIAGALGSIRPGPEGVLTGVDVAIGFAAPTSLAFADLLPANTPEFKQIVGRFHVKGTENVLAFSGVQATADGPHEMQNAVNGEIGVLSFIDDLEVRELALVIEARWPDSESVYEFIDEELPAVELLERIRPELGPMRLKGTLRNPGGTYGFNDITASSGLVEQPSIQITGDVADLLEWNNIELSGEADVITEVLLAQYFELPGGNFGKIRGEFALSDKDGDFGLTKFTANLEESALLSLSTEGLFDEVPGIEGLRLQTSVVIPDLAALGRELDFGAEGLGRLAYDGEVWGIDKGVAAMGKAKLGETDLTGKLSYSTAGDRPALQADVYSPLFRLADIGFLPEDETEDGIAAAATQAPATEAPPEFMFDETPINFEALQKIDLELDIVLEDIEGVKMKIAEAEAKIRLVAGELKLDPLTFDFVGGEAKVSLLVDARGGLPKVDLEVAAKGVDLESLLSQVEVDVPLDGTMAFLVDLSATGESPRALASSLNGDLELAIEEGHLRTGLLRLATTNPARWIFTETARNGSTEMNCLILRFDIDDGLADAKTLLLDTPHTRAFGEGNINLKNELLDISVDPQPKKKRLIAFNTPFEINGSLANPSVDVNTTGASVRKGGEIILSPVNLLGSLLVFSDDEKDEENPCLTLKPLPPSE